MRLNATRFILVSLLFVGSLGRECAEKCDIEQCALIGDCSNTIMDECECCPVCVRQIGESCGSSSEVCDNHLRCEQNSIGDESSGICVEMQQSDSSCLNARCPIAFHPKCAADSRLVILPPPKGECCGQPGTCHCDQQKCTEMVPQCEADEELVLLSSGTDEPGHCCDEFECRKKNKKCSNQCPPRIIDDEPCPADSFRPPEYVSPDSCCPIRQPCKCRGAMCRPARCGENERIKILKKGTSRPGRCCDEWKCEPMEKPESKMCRHENKEYEDGDEWHSSICDVCRCKKGIAVCTKMACPKISPKCTWIVIPEGECCPVCFGCQTDSLEKKKKHESWQKDDCTTCTCSEEGAHVCEKHMCKTDCENPRKVPGQCCPVCDEPTIVKPPATCPSLERCSLRCANGLRRDDMGCYLCECVPDGNSAGKCPELSSCDKQCAHGYMKDANGCVVCKCAKCPPLHQCSKNCLYGFETNSAGCQLCKCRASSADETKNMVASSKQMEKCVSSDGTVVRDGGEWWSDGCRHCFCEHGQEFCSLISCPPRPPECAEELWVRKDGHCCPTCVEQKKKLIGGGKHEHTVCQSPGTGRLFTDGETWQLAPCVSCTCRVGHVLCRTKECPPIACANPRYVNEEDCCPTCPDEIIDQTSAVCTDESGVAHIAGSSWRQDDCTSCMCTADGTRECYKEACDEDVACRGNPLVIKGKCCPVCSDALSSSAVCSYDSSVYSIGEQWQDGLCSNCTCVAGGQTVCWEMVCPRCEDAVPIEGHCCPLCKDVGWAPYGMMNASNPAHRNIEGSGGSVAFSFLVVSFVSMAIVGLLIVFLFIYKKSRKCNKLHKFNEVGQMGSGGASSVRLSASKAIGSMPRLVDWKDNKECAVELIKPNHMRLDSQTSDDQSDSLLSTLSDTSTAPSTASEHSPVCCDTQPLTPVRSARRFPV